MEWGVGLIVGLCAGLALGSWINHLMFVPRVIAFQQAMVERTGALIAATMYRAMEPPPPTHQPESHPAWMLDDLEEKLAEQRQEEPQEQDDEALLQGLAGKVGRNAPNDL